MVCSLLVSSAHSDGDHRCSAHRKHRRNSNGKSNERNANVYGTQSCRPHTLAHEYAVYHIVEVGHEQPAHSWEDVSPQIFQFVIHKNTSRQNKKWDKPYTGLSHFNDF